MTNSQRKQLASLLADRVRDKADVDDVVGMYGTARMLDEVNKEIRAAGDVPPGEAEQPAKVPAASVPGRRVFVQG